MRRSRNAPKAEKRPAPRAVAHKRVPSFFSDEEDPQLTKEQMCDPLHLRSSPEPVGASTPEADRLHRTRSGAAVSTPTIDESRPVSFELATYHYLDIPTYLQSNPFIRRGYRARYTMMMCLRSLFMVHTETGNVWTHLLGMLFFLVCSIAFFGHWMRPSYWTHYLVLVPFAVATIGCMGLSAAYHLFNAHYCQRVHDKMMQWDYFGITCLVVASFLPPCYYGFQCEPHLRILYLSMIGVLGSVGLVGPFFGFWAEERFYVWRVVIYTVTGGSGIFPVCHVWYALPNGTARPYVVGLALMMLFYAAGVLVYVFRVPECLFPGRFDRFLHSHQIWHTFVLCAAMVHFVNCGSMYFHWEPMEIHC